MGTLTEVLAQAKEKGVCGSADDKALHRGALAQRVSVKGNKLRDFHFTLKACQSMFEMLLKPRGHFPEEKEKNWCGV